MQLHAQHVVAKTLKENKWSKELGKKDTHVSLCTKIQKCVTSPTVWNSIPPKGGRSLSTRMYCSFPCRGGTCQQSDKQETVTVDRGILFLLLLCPPGGTVGPHMLLISSYATATSIEMKGLS